MSIAEFFIHVNDNWMLMGLCIVLSIFIYFIAFKPYWKSVLDPLSFMILGSCMGCAVVLFLHFAKLMDNIYFFSYCTTQLCFYFGFRYGYKNKLKFILRNERHIKDINQFTKYVFISAAIIDFFSQMIQYKMMGIPIFMSSRLNMMADAGGAGILTRFISICRAFTIIMGFYYMQKNNSAPLLRKFAIFYLIYVVITCILSGSRGSVLIFGTAFFYYVVAFRETYSKLNSYLSKYEFKILFVLAFLTIAVNILKFGNLSTGIEMLGVRILSFGDTYYYAYPNNLIEQVDDSQPFKSIFSSFLGFFRIYSYSELPNPIGLDLFNFFSKNGDIGGPNARHNIVAYLYFGLFGGLLFSYILGWATGYFRKLFFKTRHKTLLGIAVSAWLYGAACGIETDINLYFFKLNSFIIAVPIIIVLAFILFVLAKMRQRIISRQPGILTH
ncbi:MAG: oligosaccharide repeat unit polymerase [Bacteroides sp.]|nr:oligosaccharide repeat unit polymerase [Bacteroides sp.]